MFTKLIDKTYMILMNLNTLQNVCKHYEPITSKSDKLNLIHTRFTIRISDTREHRKSFRETLVSKFQFVELCFLKKIMP